MSHAVTPDVRPILPKDVESVVALGHTEFPEFADADSAEGPARFAEGNVTGDLFYKNFCLVAEVEGNFAGYGLVHPFMPIVDGQEVIHFDTQVAVIRQVAVKPEFRGRGVGKALVEHLLSYAARDDSSLVAAHIRDDKRLWYAEMGFELLSRGDGLAWVERPSDFGATQFPDMSEEDRSNHTPFFTLPPMLEYGYDTLALARVVETAATILGAKFAAVGQPAADKRGAAQALVQALDSGSFDDRIPVASANWLRIATLTPMELEEAKLRYLD